MTKSISFVSFKNLGLDDLKKIFILDTYHI